MSKPVRVREFVAAPVAERAASENRSFANMVEVLLLAALTERGGAEPERGHMRAEVSQQESGTSASIQRTPPRSVSADVAATIPEKMVVSDGLVRPEPVTGRCTMNTSKGVKCKFCGKVH